jgi:hypothetical protein
MKIFSSKIKNKKLVQKLVLEQKKNKKHEKRTTDMLCFLQLFMKKIKKIKKNKKRTTEKRLLK